MGRSNVDDVQHVMLIIIIHYIICYIVTDVTVAVLRTISKRMRAEHIMLFDHDDGVGFEKELFT